MAFIFGGNTDNVSEIFQDITVVGNHIYKDPTWHNGANNWAVKNGLEFKRAQRVLIDGNLVEYAWLGGGGNQNAGCLVTSPREDGNAQSQDYDFTIAHNIFQHCGEGMRLSGGDTSQPPPGGNPSARFLIQNNLYNDINSTAWGGTGDVFFMLAESGGGFSNPHDIAINHNTMIITKGGGFIFGGDAPGTVVPFLFANNIASEGGAGIGWGNSPNGNPSYIVTNTFGGANWAKNVILSTTGTGDPNGNSWPSNTFWASIGATNPVGFANFAGGNFQLTSSSPYHNAGTDGRDVGVSDWTCLNNSTNAALNGTYNASIGSCFLGSTDTTSSSIPLPPTNLQGTLMP
jgi:hypothetical protein